MEVTALSRNVRISPRKLRLVAAAIKKLPLDQALAHLTFLSKAGSKPLQKTLESAVANATTNHKLTRDTLRIKNILVDEGILIRRRWDKSHGARFGQSLQKQKGSHIKVILEG